MDRSLATLSDEDVLAHSLDNPSAFAVLLERYHGAFLRKAESVLRNREDAEDAVQDTFTKVYLAAPRFSVREGASFKSWAYRILMNTAFTRYQKRKRDRANTADLEPEFYEMLPDSTDEGECLEVTDYILSIFARMPEGAGKILSLHFLEGKPHKEIAEREGISVGAVKTRIHRAKEEFRRVAGGLNV